MRLTLGLVAMFGLALAACGGPAEEPAAPANEAEKQASEKLNIYSARHYDSDRVLYDTFEAETGIEVRFREAKAAQLLETLKAEGEASPADLIIAADAGTLWRFKDAGLTQASESATLNAAIPSNMRDPEGHWFGLAKRARVIVYDPARLSEEDVDQYSDLSEGKLRGEICMRSSSNIYNLSLLGELIERWSEDEAAAWARGVVSNFARQPQGGDTAQIESIAAGECSAALVNHYYWVRLSQNGAEARRALTEKTALSFPDQNGDGTHINVTAAAVTAHTTNQDNAIAFMEFLASPKGQSLLVTETKEFPIVEGVELPSGLETMPAFKESTLPLSTLGKNQSDAQRIYDRAGWN